jgi:transcriptional regulator with XRE-family HTH domain
MIRNLVGERIKQLRQIKKLSQEQCAFIAGIDRTYLSGVERGQRNISIINLEKICTALGVSLGEFFGGTNATN